MTIDNDSLWDAIIAREHKTFKTHRGKVFTYHIKTDKAGVQQGSLVIDNNRVEITRATVLLAYHRALEVQEKNGYVKNPGKLGSYGAVYLYPVFIDIGICTANPGDPYRQEEPFAAMPDQPVIREPEKISDRNTCSNCGYPLQEEFEFCPKCGHKI